MQKVPTKFNFCVRAFKRVDVEYDKLETMEAFGMGMDIANIRNVVLHGFPESFTHLWQQIGQCCRDGQKDVRLFIDDQQE